MLFSAREKLNSTPVKGNSANNANGVNINELIGDTDGFADSGCVRVMVFFSYF